MWNKNGGITTHYSQVEIDHLLKAVVSITRPISYNSPTLRAVETKSDAKPLKKWWLRPDLNHLVYLEDFRRRESVECKAEFSKMVTLALYRHIDVSH